MKKVILAASLLLAAGSAIAAQGTVTGNVSIIRSHDSSIAHDWVTIVGGTSAGSCTSSYNSLIAFAFEDDLKGSRHLTIALEAKLANKQITVTYDDVNFNNNGVCFVKHIDIL